MNIVQQYFVTSWYYLHNKTRSLSYLCFLHRHTQIYKHFFPGGLLCCLSTLPHLSDDLNPNDKFYLALIGQALTGIACPFISCVPTKISQHWFSDEQRTIATILLGMSNPMGIVMGQLFTPLLVHEESDVPLMNIIWFIPAGLGSILTIWKVCT